MAARNSRAASATRERELLEVLLPILSSEELAGVIGRKVGEIYSRAAFAGRNPTEAERRKLNCLIDFLRSAQATHRGEL